MIQTIINIAFDNFIIFTTAITLFFLQFLYFFTNVFMSEKEKKIQKKIDELERIYDIDEWFRKAREIDELTGANLWKQKKESDFYDYNLIQSRLEDMKNLYEKKNYQELMYLIRGGLERNLGGILNSKLYKVSIVGTKVLIEDYINWVVKILKFIQNAPDNEVPMSEKFSFFMEVRQRFGRTALLLSGGAAFGMFHVGTARMFVLTDYVPRVICGSSAGGIIAGGFASTEISEFTKFDHPANYQLKAFSKEEPHELYENFKRLFSKGSFLDVDHLVKCMKDNLDDLTFKEVYEKTGRILNITIGATDVHEMPKLLNYLTAPDVVIWPAVAASCAFPGLFDPIPLIERRKNGDHNPYHQPASKWRDGSLEHDLPMRRLSEMFNVNFHIVSQVNPHVIPIYHLCQYRPVKLILGLIGSEIKHRILQLAAFGFVPRLLEKAITQDYTGDITIVPRPRWWQYLRVISNPSEDMMWECMLQGRQAFLRKFSQFEIGFKIEDTLEKIVSDLCSSTQIPYAKETVSTSSEKIKTTSYLSLDKISALHLSSTHLPEQFSSDLANDS